MDKGKITVFSGNGKGKTAAALGIALDAAADGKTVVVIQFLKGKGLAEAEFCKRMEPEIKIFRFEKSDVDFEDRTSHQQADDVESIRNSLGFARKVLVTGECDILIMDEVLGLIDNGIISVSELRDLVDHRGDTEVIFTGRVMDDELCVFVDEISQISTVQFKKFDA
ncbi:MAG: cob(I)yrinic acid a,c-diamide adenosyltransferase [Lachnospiraceae bacterium]|jgi:cob(I)alamin adenosyltransferase|nr:cob(I)yrinic acid a,c-diamide adenosyltransferase [Lachnospiraceae bacterium]MDO4407404.1 cob(I)yrinic acid a,c-diamide adenosyltransferase [Eubacteriales bacterium]